MENFKEHDIVTLKIQIKTNELELSKGTDGTIVHVYNGDNYEVEFNIDDNIFIEVVNKSMICLKK